jgi:hypothetical protein
MQSYIRNLSRTPVFSLHTSPFPKIRLLVNEITSTAGKLHSNF